MCGGVVETIFGGEEEEEEESGVPAFIEAPAPSTPDPVVTQLDAAADFVNEQIIVPAADFVNESVIEPVESGVSNVVEGLGTLLTSGGVPSAPSAPEPITAVASPTGNKKDEDDDLDFDPNDPANAGKARHLKNRRAFQRFGAGNTLLTGGTGLVDKVATGRPTLLGA